MVIYIYIWGLNLLIFGFNLGLYYMVFILEKVNWLVMLVVYWKSWVNKCVVFSIFMGIVVILVFCLVNCLYKLIICIFKGKMYLDISCYFEIVFWFI